MMNSKLKRLIALLLSVLMVAGMFPMSAFATETEAVEAVTETASAGAPGMTVSVTGSQISIKVDRVGTKGTATLYRVAADAYLAGDTLTGKSAQTNAEGTVVGEYSCGSTQTFTINRYLSDGSDNLYDKYYLVQNGTILAGPVYATEISSLRTKPAFEHASKKGVTLEDASTINIAKEMGATNTVINYNLSEMIVATEDADGNPRNLSSRTDLISFVSNGKTFYFKSDYVRAQDGLISAYTKEGMNVTLAIIAWAKTVTNDYPRSMMYWNQTNRQTLAYNTANDLGMEYWIAAMEFLADRYSKSESMGLVQKFIIGNEIDYTYDWYLIEPLVTNDKGHYFAVDFDIFMEEFARTFRLANLAVKKYNSEAKVCVSLTHNWALNSAEAYNSGGTSVRQNSYRPKEIIDWLVEVEGARGDYNWGLAVHPYAVGTNPSNPLKTDVAGTYGRPVTGDPDTTPWITVSNLEMYQLYLQRPENLYNGKELRTVSLTETTVLSTKSSDPYYSTSILEQAASIAQTYYRSVAIPCIDQMAYFQVHDQTTTSYMVGLMTSSGVKKPAYDVWKYIDTDKTFVYANKYLKHINSSAKSYKELMPAVKSDFDWDAAWDEEKIIYRTVEGGDSERSLTTNKSQYNADDLILVTAKGDLGDTVELFLASDDISKAEPLYSYPVVGDNAATTFMSGKECDIVAYGTIGMSRLDDAVLKAGTYQVVLRRGDTGETIAKNITINGDYTMGVTDYSLITDKTTYESGEEIIVSATGNTQCWVGLYKKDDVYGSGNTTSIFWYYNNDKSTGQISGKPTVLQTGLHNADSSNPGMILSPGEYVLYLFDGTGGNAYNAVMSQALTIVEKEIEPLTGVTYKLDNETDGFANGAVTVTKNAKNAGAVKCAMYWGDAEGKPLSDFGAMATFKLESAKTTYRMPSHMIIPEGAKQLLAYASDGNTLSSTAVSVQLPENSDYVMGEEPKVEFQVVSDIHVTTPSGATGEVTNSNKHFSMMLSDVMKNSPNSIGIFASGDIVNNGQEAQYKTLLDLFYNAYAEGTPPDLHIAVGNHDWLNGNPNKQFQKYAALFNASLTSQPETIYYDEVVNGYNFIYLGGERDNLRASISQEQLTWFDNRMAEITAKDPNKPVFVLLHQSFYNTIAGSLPGQGWDGVSNEDTLKAIMKKYGQIILLNGHSHWDLNSYRNMFPGDSEGPTALNTGSVSYLWTSENVMGGEFLYGSQGYYVRVYDDKVVFMGRDFVNQKFLPSATYVLKRNEITGVEDSYDVYIDQKAVNLGAKALDGSTVYYRSSDDSIASITDDGTVIAKKPGTVQVTITAESSNTTVISKKVVTINVSEDTRTFTVIFKNWDDSVLSTNTYGYGDTVAVPTVPTRSSDKPEEYTWEFTGWDHPVVNCEGDTTYVAQFKKVMKEAEPTATPTAAPTTAPTVKPTATPTVKPTATPTVKPTATPVPVKITTQPKTTYTKSGSTAKLTVKAAGDGLTYAWYVKNKGASKFTKVSTTASTYSVKMSSTIKDREVYCVVKDKYGKTERSDTVTLRMAATVTTQPKTTYTKSGSTAKVTVKAAGDGLKYTWYMKNKGASKFTKSSLTTATYSTTMSSTTKDRQVYCVVKDKYGKTAQSDTVTLRMAATVTTQPKTTYTKSGSTAKVTVKAAGDGLKYTWYYKNKGASKFTKATAKTATYSAKMTSKINGRQVYCVVKDKYGKTVKSSTVTLKMK